MSFRAVDLQVILPRLEQAARYQGQQEQQAQLKHQIAYQEQKQLTHRTQQVQVLPRSEESHLFTRPDEEGRKGRYRNHRTRNGRKRQGRGGEPPSGGRLDLRV